MNNPMNLTSIPMNSKHSDLHSLEKDISNFCDSFTMEDHFVDNVKVELDKMVSNICSFKSGESHKDRKDSESSQGQHSQSQSQTLHKQKNLQNLLKQLDELEAMVQVTKNQLKAHSQNLVTKGKEHKDETNLEELTFNHEKEDKESNEKDDHFFLFHN